MRQGGKPPEPGPAVLKPRSLLVIVRLEIVVVPSSWQVRLLIVCRSVSPSIVIPFAFVSMRHDSVPPPSSTAESTPPAGSDSQVSPSSAPAASFNVEARL